MSDANGGGFRALKKTTEAPYTTKVNYREHTSRGTTLGRLSLLESLLRFEARPAPQFCECSVSESEPPDRDSRPALYYALYKLTFYKVLCLSL